MSTFTYTLRDSNLPDRSIIHKVAWIFHDHEIPNFLWRDGMLKYYGVSQSYRYDFEFVIPDRLIDTAAKVLRDAGFQDKRDSVAGTCRFGDGSQAMREDPARINDWPYYYFHLYQRSHNDGSSHRHVLLHRQSEYFWNLPEIPLMPPPDDPDFMMANDLRLPEIHEDELPVQHGRCLRTICPIVLPTPARYIESLILLLARDFETTDSYHHRSQLGRFHQDCKMLDRDMFSPENLHPRFQKYWGAILDGKEESHLFAELREGLLKDGNLPETPYTWLLPKVPKHIADIRSALVTLVTLVTGENPKPGACS